MQHRGLRCSESSSRAAPTPSFLSSPLPFSPLPPLFLGLFLLSFPVLQFLDTWWLFFILFFWLGEREARTHPAIRGRKVLGLILLLQETKRGGGFFHQVKLYPPPPSPSTPFSPNRREREGGGGSGGKQALLRLAFGVQGARK